MLQHTRKTGKPVPSLCVFSAGGSSLAGIVCGLVTKVPASQTNVSADSKKIVLSVEFVNN